MGAVANMAPELFLGIIAEVPFVDVLTTMLDASLPLTPPEWPEWGNPIESEAGYRTIAAYSPYDNVWEQAYPHILALAGLTDPRVTYWEPAKWIAKLRELATSDGLILLQTNMEAGHAGASGRFERLKEVHPRLHLRVEDRSGLTQQASYATGANQFTLHAPCLLIATSHSSSSSTSRRSSSRQSPAKTG